MDKDNAKTRSKLKQISSVSDFRNILQETMLSDEEEKILWMHYKEQKPLGFIADSLCISEASVKKKHKNLLIKIGKMI